MRSTLPAVALAALSALSGCATGSLETTDLEGVRYRIEGAGIHFQTSAGLVEAGNQVSRISVRQGRLYTRERELGPVGPGDSVLLTESGSVLVNGEAR